MLAITYYLIMLCQAYNTAVYTSDNLSGTTAVSPVVSK